MEAHQRGVSNEKVHIFMEKLKKRYQTFSIEPYQELYQWLCVLQMNFLAQDKKVLLMSTHNRSRVDRKTVASQMVVFPNT